MLDLLTQAMSPPLIIGIHGAVANAATWLPLQREMGESVEFLAPDLPGHGTRRQERFTIEAALATIADLIPQPEAGFPRPVVLIGDSLGGYLAILAAAQLQERVSAVIAASASFPMTGAAGVIARATDLPVQAAKMMVGRERLESALMQLFTRFTDAPTAEAIAARGLCLPSRSESLRELRNLDMLAALKTISSPVYIVNGSYDIPTQWFTRTFARAAKDGYAVIIPGAFHGCTLSHAHEFAEIIRTALIRIQRGTAQALTQR